ncbi:MAG: glutamate-5-semialdehyde dehydrogenase [Alphaproteobacteria bacterium]
MSSASSLAVETDQAVERQVLDIGRRAKAAAASLALADSGAKKLALQTAAATIRSQADALLAANAEDVAFGQGKNLSAALIDRLTLTPDRIEAMAAGLDAVADLPDPVGTVMAEWDRPNGLKFQRVRVPLGVIGVIYESRPNVTADAGGLCIAAGNAVILRGGSESINSSGLIVDCLRAGLQAAGLNEDAVQMIPTRSRDAVGALLRMADYVDVIVPRGGRGLIERVMEDAAMPVFAHLDGLCHVYVDRAADPEKARAIAVNAKMRRTGVCGAAETLLVDAGAPEGLLPALIDDLIEAGCAVRGDAIAQATDDRVTAAEEGDWTTEYLAPVISLKVVDGVDAAIDHINLYGSHHTDSIVTEDTAAAERFLNRVDSAICLHNASTQFADGGEFGMGAEIGISTGRMHARGPVGVEQLTSFKYKVRGSGQTRP